VDNAVKQFLSGRVHQYVARLAPLGLRITHLGLDLSMYCCATDSEDGNKCPLYTFSHIVLGNDYSMQKYAIISIIPNKCSFF
jgi:hypothetical protein